MHLLRAGLAISVAGLLSACFMSDTPFIPDEDAVRLSEGETVLVCTNDDDCARTVPNRGNPGYLMMPPPDEGEDEGPMAIRFAPLVEASFGPVWLAEIKMVDEDDGDVAYVVGAVRRAPEFDDGETKAFDVELPWCDDVPEPDLDTYGITKLDSYTCALPTKASISDYLRATHMGFFEDPDWWEDS
jgi:hypothetical protein